ncbi:MAG: ATP-binding protein [Thermoanaerobaculia bacterium]
MSPVQPLAGALLQSAHDPMWIIDSSRTLIAFNRAFARLFESIEVGIDASHLFDEAWPELLDRALRGHSVLSNVRYYSIAATPVIEGDTTTHAVFTARLLSDLTAGKREDLFELSLTRLFIDDERPLMRTLLAAVEYLCESDEWDCGIIWLLGEDDTTALDPIAIYASPALPHGSDLAQRMRGMRFPRGHGLPGRVWAADDMVWIGDIADDSKLTRAYLAEQFGLHGAVAVPLRDGPRIVGVLELFTRNVRPLDTIHARALLRTGAGLGRLIERRRAEDERRHLLHVIERKGLEWSLTFDAIELPIFITSMDGVVRRMNRSARDLAGGDYAEALGRRIRSYGLHEPWTTLAACVEAVRDSGETCTAQAYDPESDRSWDITGNAYHPEDETPRVILIARDTTSVVQLQNAVKRGEQLSALGELVAGVAHEVRNPIFGMQITLEALESTLPHTDDVTDLLTVMRRWLDRLNRLMESLLAYGRTWTIDLRPGSVGEVLRRAIEDTEAFARNANVQMRVDIDVRRTSLMDQSRLVQAFENLIINAIQHADSERYVDVSAREVDGYVECVVRDYGSGFATEDLPRIFEPFYTKRRGGTGLGLAIVHRIVEEHGGTVRAGNAEDGGARITVRFPVYQATP